MLVAHNSLSEIRIFANLGVYVRLDHLQASPVQGRHPGSTISLINLISLISLISLITVRV